MIHRFRVRNFRSVRESVELDFRIPRTAPDLPCFRPSRSRPDIRLPTVTALIGPNGSGKTTLLRALDATVRFVTEAPTGRRLNSFLPFGSPESRIASTDVEVEFDMSLSFLEPNGIDFLCRYRLTLERDGSDIAPVRVGYEALHTFPKGRPRRVLERRGNEPIHVAAEVGLRPRDERLRAVPPHASAISALSWMSVPAFAEISQDIGGFLSNIGGPVPWKPDTETVVRLYRDHPELVTGVSNKLHASTSESRIWTSSRCLIQAGTSPSDITAWMQPYRCSQSLPVHIV